MMDYGALAGGAVALLAGIWFGWLAKEAWEKDAHTAIKVVCAGISLGCCVGAAILIWRAF